LLARAPKSRYPRRGEIYLVRLDKLRSALVISSDALNRHALDVCVVPITSVEHTAFLLRVPLSAREGGLTLASWAKCDQVTTLEKRLLQYPPLGTVTPQSLGRIELAIKRALDMH
jgi:mRNA interferase MazF